MGLDQARLEGEEYYQVGAAAGLSMWGCNGEECPCLHNTGLGVHGLLGPCTVTCPPAQANYFQQPVVGAAFTAVAV